MGGADQDMKFANLLSREEGRRRLLANINQSLQKSGARDPLQRLALCQGVFSLSI